MERAQAFARCGTADALRFGLDGIGRTIHPYPTQAEVFRRAADARRRARFTPRARRIMAAWFRRFR
ncbi:hypothetical protein [Gemmatimonas sp.]|uniref:hypothetical protein n=1 Tax=Gemmatimonas sp. TaxID=1962908 RepID=UPI0037BFA51D